MAESEASTEQSEPPQLVVQQFSMEALHHIMMANNSQILGLYDEMSVMYGQLDAYKHSGSRLDRSTLLDLYNGGSWSRNFRNKEQAMVKMQQTAFNMCGFIQPAFILSMLDTSDPDAFNDRQFFICPEEVEYMYSDLKVPMDPAVVKLENIFRRIKYSHQDKMATYTFDDAAQAAFIEAHDKLCTRKLQIPDDEDRRGILSKARGQLARIAMIIHALEQAIQTPINEDCPNIADWNTTVEENSVKKAETIITYIIEVKFALMQPEVLVGSVPDRNSNIQTGRAILDSNPKYLSKFLSFKNTNVQASDVSQFRLMPPTPNRSQSKNKYPVEQCKSFMKEVSEAVFGSVDEVKKNGSVRKSFTFKKRLFNELGSVQQDTLKKLKISEDVYNCTPSSSSFLTDDSSFLSLVSDTDDNIVPIDISTRLPRLRAHSVAGGRCGGGFSCER